MRNPEINKLDVKGGVPFTQLVSISSNPRFSSVSVVGKSDRWSPRQLRRPTRVRRSSCPNSPSAFHSFQAWLANQRNASRRSNPTPKKPLAGETHRWLFSTVTLLASVRPQIATQLRSPPKSGFGPWVFSTTSRERAEYFP